METWRRITTWGMTPEFNMGLDEALLEMGDVPTLRLYSWSPATLSLGYFQRFEDVPAAAEVPSVVRRITGGGAIHHDGELTFSLTCPLDHPLYRGPVAASYERVHGALLRALAAVGLEARLRGAGGLDSDRAATGMCFHESTPLDIVWGERKGVGSAQRRRNGRVLHHGSIKLDAGAHEPGIASARASGVSLTPQAFAPTLLAALESELGLATRPGVPDVFEREAAKHHGERYTDPAWVRRR